MTAGQLVAILALEVASREATSRTPLQIFLITSAGAAALLLVLAILSPRLLRTDLRGLGFRAPSPRAVRFTLRAALGLWVASILANLASISIFGPNPQPLVVSFSAHRGLEAIGLDLLTGALVAPLSEETLYRGVVFAGLAQRLPFLPAALISGLLFAIPHGIGVLAPILVLGTGLAWIYARTGTLWAPILAHSLVNAISLGILFIARPPLT